MTYGKSGAQEIGISRRADRLASRSCRRQSSGNAGAVTVSTLTTVALTFYFGRGHTRVA